MPEPARLHMAKLTKAVCDNPQRDPGTTMEVISAFSMDRVKNVTSQLSTAKMKVMEQQSEILEDGIILGDVKQ